MRLGSPLKNHTCEHGEASSMWPRRSRRTFDKVTSTPHLSQITPRCFIRLYLPQRHSQSVTGPKFLVLSKRSAAGCAPSDGFLLNPLLFLLASAASSTQRRGRAIATREPAR